jgi:hypothetical protein
VALAALVAEVLVVAAPAEAGNQIRYIDIKKLQEIHPEVFYYSAFAN